MSLYDHLHHHPNKTRRTLSTATNQLAVFDHMTRTQTLIGPTGTRHAERS